MRNLKELFRSLPELVDLHLEGSLLDGILYLC